MAPAAGDEPTVDGIGGAEGGGQCNGEGAPEERRVEPCVHRTRHGEDDRIVDDLHHGDRQRVGRERDADRGAEREPTANERHERERVAEEKRERDGERDRRRVAPAERRADREAEHLADAAARQAVQGRAQR